VTVWPILDGKLFLALAYAETAARRHAGGACDDTPELASVRAQGEAIERASLIENGPSMVVTRQEALERGLSLVVPHDILRDAEDWVVARRATTGEGVGVPADVVMLGRVSSQLRLLPWRQSSVGTAAHPDRDAAALSGILECVERYALRRVWAGTATLEPATEQLCGAMPPGLVEAFGKLRLVAHAWHVREMSQVRVSLVLLARTDRSQATFGAGAAFAGVDDGRVLMHALHEAVMVRASLSSRTNQNEREVQRGIRSSRHQEAFLTYLRNLEAPAPVVDGTADVSAPSVPDLAAMVEERFGVAPLLVDVPSLDTLAVVKAVVPTAEFLIPRSDGDYILRPGYLE